MKLDKYTPTKDKNESHNRRKFYRNMAYESDIQGWSIEGSSSEFAYFLSGQEEEDKCYRYGKEGDPITKDILPSLTRIENGHIIRDPGDHENPCQDCPICWALEHHDLEKRAGIWTLQYMDGPELQGEELKKEIEELFKLAENLGIQKRIAQEEYWGTDTKPSEMLEKENWSWQFLVDVYSDLLTQN